LKPPAHAPPNRVSLSVVGDRESESDRGSLLVAAACCASALSAALIPTYGGVRGRALEVGDDKELLRYRQAEPVTGECH